jgi:CRISPR-associated protein Cas1
MIKRIVEISSARTHLSIRYGQLLIRQQDKPQTNIPCEDIGVLLVDHQATTYTHTVFTQLLKSGAAVVLCGPNHHPTGMLLPIETNTIQTERFRTQLQAKEPVRKNLWKQLIRAKIKHQANVLGRKCEIYTTLMRLRHKVRSGDPSNIEAQAGKKYWPYFIGDGNFRRDINARGVNSLLNYGYMVLRAAVARALCSAGLHPSLGIHHHNRYNAFCLADDVLEPFRGFVDKKVRQICPDGRFDRELDQPTKAKLLEVLYQEVSIASFAGPLMVGLHRTAASLVRVFAGDQKEIDLPRL